jgi:hypothetical protein
MSVCSCCVLLPEDSDGCGCACDSTTFFKEELVEFCFYCDHVVMK